MTDFEIHCTRTGCERTFASEHGLAVHLARSHAGTIRDERTPALGDVSVEMPAPVEELVDEPDDDGPLALEGIVLLDAEEVELLAAMRFLFRWDDESGALTQAMNDLFDWARADADVQALLKIKRRTS